MNIFLQTFSKKLVLAILTSLVFSLTALANPKVLMETSMGNIELELYEDKAPATVKNFLTYVNEGFYDGTIFHRVIKKFMIQGGGFDKTMKRKETHAPIKNEAENGLQNKPGTISMARTSDPHSATAQFFINAKNNSFLNFRDKTPRAWGYAVFGRVSKGMDVVKAIENVRTGVNRGFRDVPVKTVTINKVSVIK